MLSARVARNTDGTTGMLASKTPAGKTPGRRVAFGDISNRKPVPGQTAGIKKGTGAPPKSVRRVVNFKIASDEIKEHIEKTADAKSIEDDVDDISIADISRFRFREPRNDVFQLDEDDWKEILDDEKKQLEIDQYFIERRRELAERDYNEKLELLQQSIDAMHEQDGKYNDLRPGFVS